MGQNDDNVYPTRPRRVTATDVAKAAGVSRSAVSRAFTEGAYLDQEKKARILEVAQELGYRPNAFAASLQSTHSNIVAVITGNMKSVFDSELVNHLVDRLTEAGKWPIVVSGERIANAKSIHGIFGFPVDAMIVRGGSMDQYMIESCAKLNIPLIFSGVIVDSKGVDSVACKNTEGSYEVTKLLLKKGRKRFGFIDGPSQIVSNFARKRGVEMALKDAGLQLICADEGDYTYDGGMELARKMLREHELDALVCANDAMALAALSVAREEIGLNVPEDISITGFDNITMAAWPCFNLTTVRNPIDEIVSEVIRMLSERLENPDKPGEAVALDAELVPRGTH